MKSPKLGAISQLKENRKLLFCEALDALETWGEWELINNLCREALSLGLEGDTPSFFVCDLQIWKKFASAASKVEESERCGTWLRLFRFLAIKVVNILTLEQRPQ